MRLTRQQWLDLSGAGIALAVYVVVQGLLLLGPHPYDPSRYFATAVKFPHVGADLWTLRIGLIAPVAIAVRLMGGTEAALYAVPMAAGVLLVTAVYCTTLVLFGDRLLAALAGLVAGLNADFLLNSSFIFPDTVGTATFSAGFLFLVLGARAAKRPGVWAPRIAVLCAGFFFGWTYLIRDFSPILLPVVVIAAILLRYPLRRLGLLAAGAVGTAALELVYGALRFGDPLVHLRLLLHHRTAAFRPGKAAAIQAVQDETQNPLGALRVLPRLILTWDTGWFLLVLIPLFAVAVLLLRDRRLWLLAVWFFGFWATMVVIALGELPSGRWIINVTNVRYWYPAFPALAMGGLAGVWLLVRRFAPGRRAVLAARLAVVALSALVLLPGLAEFRSCAAKNPWRNDPRGRWDELRSWLGREDASRYSKILTDAITGRILDPAFLHATVGGPVWPGQVRTWGRAAKRIVPVTDLGRSLLLINQPRFRGADQAMARLDELEAEWAPVFVSEDRALVLLAHKPAAPLPVDAPKPWWSDPPVPPKVRPAGCGI